MALKTNELFSSYSGDSPPPIDARHVMPVKAGPDGIGDVEYDYGTLLALDTVNEYYVAWDPAGANGINVPKVVLWPNKFTPDVADESIVQVMFMGTVRFEDLKAAPGIVATPTDIRDAVKDSFRELGILVQNLDSIS